MDFYTLINNFNVIHNNAYEYGDFIDKFYKIDILCRHHGWFKQNIYKHKIHNCPKCVGGIKISIEDFILKANKIHNNKFDYSKVIYENSKTKIVIICKIHGSFEQKPNDHLSGNGCPVCANNAKISNEEFIFKSKKLFKDKYNYDKCSYTNQKGKICLLCIKHNNYFWQQAGNHLKLKEGCNKCIIEKNHYSTEEFIEKSILIHGFKYNYNYVDYSSIKKEVKIECKIHGVFTQKPSIHLSGSGCQSCNSSKGEEIILEFLKENNILYTRQKTFINCKNKNVLRFDFYLNDYNICIEYDGQQHYFPNDYFGGNDSFKKLKENDFIKNKYCEKNNINILRIPFFNKNDIPSILKKLLNNGFSI